MDKATRKSLTSAEFALLRATEREEMEGLDEDELLALHSRVRRARNKHSKLHRRQSAAQVQADRARGNASKKNPRAAAKAEVFEDALARVSRRLAVVARDTAAELKAERLAAARAGSPKKAKQAKKAASRSKGAAKGAKGKASAKKGDASLRSPVKAKKKASARAKNARAQARRDNR